MVIPKQLRPQIKRDIHIGHTGVEGCLRRARESVYCPNMNAELKEMVLSCETCRCYEVSYAKEPLMSHEIPQRQWQKIDTDLFSLNGRDYLITVCYFSIFWEIDRLHDTNSKTVISKLKAHCARYGIPEEIVSDNVPQFSSINMGKFMGAWGIMHKTISTYNSKSNGKVESTVKTAKRMLKKTVKSGEDQYLALLNIRNPPTQGLNSSPVQRLMCRRTRTVVPIREELLNPEIPLVDTERQKMKGMQEKQASYYNSHTQVLPELKEDDSVKS